MIDIASKRYDSVKRFENLSTAFYESDKYNIPNSISNPLTKSKYTQFSLITRLAKAINRLSCNRMYV